MSAPTPDEIGSAASAGASSWGASEYARGRADQLAVDQPKLDALTGQLNAENAHAADLQAELDDALAKIAKATPAPEATVYGSGIGGWGKAEGGKNKSYARLTRPENFGPLKFIRDFDSSVPTYLDPAAEVFLDPGGSVSDATLDQLQARKNRSWLSLLHEPERNASDPTSWAKLQNDTAKRLADRGCDNVTLVPTLMGGTVIGRVQGAYTADQWLAGIDWDLIDYVGFDIYQWAKNDTNADTIPHLMDPVAALLTKLKKKGVLGEFGVRRVNPPYSPGISDGLRASSIMALDAWNKAHPGLVTRVAYFEAGIGQPDLVPWNLTNPPTQTTPYSPKALAAWRELCQR